MKWKGLSQDSHLKAHIWPQDIPNIKEWYPLAWTFGNKNKNGEVKKLGKQGREDGEHRWAAIGEEGKEAEN